MMNEYFNEPYDRFEKRYGGTVYVTVAGDDYQLGRAFRSISAIRRRPGDSEIVFGIGTKGQDVREEHIRRFLDSRHDFILFLDGDMLFPAMALERLRSHRLPCVSGLYYRRSIQPIMPIWYEDDPAFQWPLMPFRQTPQAGRLYRLSATGFGCWLIHRDVLEAVDAMLYGEALVWEDDMDVWPYDLRAVLDGREQLRPLRGRKDRVGADVRLGYFIRRAGFELWGDAAVSCGHLVNYDIDITDWQGLDAAERAAFAHTADVEVRKMRDEHTAQAVTA